MLQDVCARMIGVLLSFLDNAAVCLCQNDRCVVIVHRQCCRMFVSERYIVLLLFIDNAAGCLCQNDGCVIIHRQCCRMFVSE